MSQIQKSVELLAETLQGKNQDYTGGRGEFYNFEKSAEFAGINPRQAIFVEIAKKMTRLEALRGDGLVVPNFESVQDTLLDLAGYSVIAHAYFADREIPKPTWDPAG